MAPGFGLMNNYLNIEVDTVGYNVERLDCNGHGSGITVTDRIKYKQRAELESHDF